MADEISLSISLRAVKGSLEISKSVSQTITIATAKPNAAGGTQAIGFAAHEAVTLGDVAANGVAFFRNLDTTNFVQIGVDVSAAFHPLVRLNAGECCVMRLSAAVAPYAQADTAAVIIEKIILDT